MHVEVLAFPRDLKVLLYPMLAIAMAVLVLPAMVMVVLRVSWR